MTISEQRRALDCAVTAAQAAGELLRRNLRAPKRINESSPHDIKLELDVRCQQRIERILARAFPEVAVLGEEGVSGGEAEAEYRWVIDPIDGTVNYTYGIPHACPAIALQVRADRLAPARRRRSLPVTADGYVSLVGVTYDPFRDELWTAIRGGPARLNGRPIHVSSRRQLSEAVISIGFAKYAENLQRMLPMLGELAPRVRKVRIMGAAALDMVYVATGRFDGYVESGLRLWDIAAGGLILECAGGDFWHQPVPGQPHTYRVVANNGPLRRPLLALVATSPADAASGK